jgi:uroporphyrinogen decarboxylase
MNPREIVMESLRHHQPERVPYTLAFDDGMDLKLDEYLGTSAWREQITPYILGVGAVDTDYKVPLGEGRTRDAYGGIWREDRRPWHLEKPPLERPSFEGYVFPKPESFYRPEWKARARQTIADHPHSFIVGNLGWGLFERSWNLRGFENILVDVISEPDFFEEAVERIMRLYLDFVEYTAELPLDGILFGDDWGDQRGIIIGPKRWRKFLKPRWAQIYAAVHQHGMVVMHHSCGSVAEIMPDLVEIGMDVLESVQPEAAGMNPYELKKKWGDKICFWGGLGSQSVIPFGTPEQLKTEIRRLKVEVGRDGGYILAPAKPLQPGTPFANALAILEAFTQE